MINRFLKKYLSSNFLKTLTVATVIILVCFAINISPVLRGPAPYPPEWQWGYQINFNLNKIIIFSFVLGLVFLSYFYFEKNKNKTLFEFKFLTIMVFIFFLFQLSIVNLSKGGLGVLFYKIANPGYNGYFTASLGIKNAGSFLHNYNKRVLSQPQHARGHPPGIILLSHSLNNLVKNFPVFKTYIDEFKPKRDDIRKLWNGLSWNEKLGSILLGPLVSFLTLLSLIPIFYIGKRIGGITLGIRSVLVYGLVPSVSLFLPLPDSVFAVFGAFSLMFLTIAIKEEKLKFYFYSGLFLSFGLFFSLSILPLILFSLIVIFISRDDLKKQIIKTVCLLAGVVVIPVLLYIFLGYDSAKVITNIISGLAPRSYFIWLFFNLYDFLLFAGIPISIAYLYALKKGLKNLRKKVETKDIMLISLTITILMVDFLGSSRAEVGRIWLPFIPALVITATSFLSRDLRINKYGFASFLFLLAIQILIFSNFLVLYG